MLPSASYRGLWFAYVWLKSWSDFMEEKKNWKRKEKKKENFLENLNCSAKKRDKHNLSTCWTGLFLLLQGLGSNSHSL